MTETEWYASPDPAAMVEFVRPRASNRKLQLLGVACCRRVWHVMTDPRHRDAVDAAERFADGFITEEEFDEIAEPIVAQWCKLPSIKKVAWQPFHYLVGAIRH